MSDIPNAPSQEQLASSPVSRCSNKARVPPPITPGRFNRFFNPQPSQESISSSSGRELRDITSSAINRGATGVELLPFGDLPNLRPTKRRRRSDDILEDENSTESSTVHSSPCQTVGRTRIGVSSPLMYRALIRRARQQPERIPHWQSQTANFYSGPEDSISFLHRALPFCNASCNSNSLVAIGDETGAINVRESAKDINPPFNTPYVSFRPHQNAIMDLAFSSDDRLLATASGDQTARVTDMQTQTPLFVLAKHSSSVKQVTFQPGDDNIIATCSRDSAIALWDLRCSVSSNKVSVLERSENTPGTLQSTIARYPKMYKSIVGGHRVEYTGVPLNLRGKETYPSITALRFLPTRSHLFITASDSSAHIKLWDIRSRYSSRSPPLPVSTSGTLPSHRNHRHFGINSLVFNTSSDRLYTVCKDSIVYVYSTSHLVLGTPPDASQRWSKAGREGLGPLYGLQHPSFHINTFYIKGAMRRAHGPHSELLGVGSSHGCPVLFPTDERQLLRGRQRASVPCSDTPPVQSSASSRPTSVRSPATWRPHESSREPDAIPIYETGTPLVRGHANEVTALSWTTEGELISIGDDFQARCWREGGAGVARELRLGGNGEGRRHRCGWAEVEKGWDEEDG